MERHTANHSSAGARDHSPHRAGGLSRLPPGAESLFQCGVGYARAVHAVTFAGDVDPLGAPEVTLGLAQIRAEVTRPGRVMSSELAATALISGVCHTTRDLPLSRRSRLLGREPARLAMSVAHDQQVLAETDLRLAGALARRDWTAVGEVLHAVLIHCARCDVTEPDPAR